MQRARDATVLSTRELIDELPRRAWDHDQGEVKRYRTELAQAMGNARHFRQIASELGIKFEIVRATWIWPATTVAEEVITGTRAAAVEWLAGWVYHECNRMLRRSMERAWFDAFEPPATRFLRSTVTPSSNTTFSSSSILEPDPPF